MYCCSIYFPTEVSGYAGPCASPVTNCTVLRKQLAAACPTIILNCSLTLSDSCVGIAISSSVSIQGECSDYRKPTLTGSALGAAAAAATAEPMFTISNPSSQSIDVRFANLIFSNHTAASAAAALTVLRGQVNLTLANVDVFDMKAPAGAVLMLGSFNSSSIDSSLSVINGTFARCTSTEPVAFAAVFNTHGISHFDLSNAAFFNNTGLQSAAVLALHTSSVSVTSCSFRQNTATSVGLSATALLLAVDTAIVTDTQFIQNIGSPLVIYGSRYLATGGPNPSSIQVERSSFIRNTGSITGGLAIGMADLTCVTGSSFEGNFGTGVGYPVTPSSGFGPVGGVLIDTAAAFVGDALTILDSNANYTYPLSVRALRQYNQPLPSGFSMSEASLFNSKITAANSTHITQPTAWVYAPGTLLTNLNLCKPVLASSANDTKVILSTTASPEAVLPLGAPSGAVTMRVCDATPADSYMANGTGVQTDCSRCIFTGPLQCSAWTAAMVSSQQALNQTASSQTSLYRSHPVMAPSVEGMVTAVNKVFAAVFGSSSVPPKLFA